VDSQQAYFDYLSKRSRLSLAIRKCMIRDLCRHFSGSVLDIGCGIGEFLRDYQTSIGIDLNEPVVRHCVMSGYPCSVAGCYRLPFVDGAFDGVLASNLFEHLTDVAQAFSEAARVLKPGGTLVITVPMEAGFKHDSTHVTMLSESTLRALADQSSFSVKTVYRYPFPWRWTGKLFYFCELRAVMERT
jgi:SAM-dependent methyltransferase